MSELNQASYRESISKAVSNSKEQAQTPKDYFSVLPVRIGIIAGIIGAFGIIAVITILALIAGYDIWLSPRFIASVILRDAAWSAGAMGIFAITLGTLMHLFSGAIYGAIFAYIMPKMPRGFWFVAGIIFGVAIWGIAVIGIPLLTPTPMNEISTLSYTNALIMSHVIFGITLGVAGSFFGDIQSQ